jgi:hypothetical protein
LETACARSAANQPALPMPGTRATASMTRMRRRAESSRQVLYSAHTITSTATISPCSTPLT